MTGMPLPVGVTTATVTFGGDSTIDGQPVRATLIFAASTPLMYGGQRILYASIVARADFGDTGAVVLPHTNQAGFTDPAGAALTSWHYRVTGDYYNRAGAMQHIDKPVTLPVGQTTIDLDAIPDGPATPPTTGPSAVVTSVGGETGEVTTGELETILRDAGWAKVIVADAAPPEPVDPDSVVWVAPA